MEYTINEIAKLSGVSTRTLRYYDEIGLLIPKRKNASGYRVYGSGEVNRLQEILFYRTLGVGLNEINLALSASLYDRQDILEDHLQGLKDQRKQIDALITNVEDSLKEMKGELVMGDEAKFNGLKQGLIIDNEFKYGKEVRKTYGKDVVDASNAKLLGMSREAFDEAFSPRLNEALIAALKTDDPTGDVAYKACEMHRDWLTFFWPEGTYSKQAHLSLAQMYVDDERFKKHYENIAPGLSEFLLKALTFYCNKA